MFEKNYIAISLNAFAMSCILIFSLAGCLGKQNTYGVVSMPAVSEDGKYINCIIAESEGTTYMENGGYNKTTYRTTYWLRQYETATGKLTNKKKLVPSSAADNVDINCLGSFDNKIWLYVNGIRAYDMYSLEEITNEEKIAAANGMKKTIFPYGERLVYAAVEKGYIDFTADNGGQYRLQLKELKIINKEEIKDTGAKKRIIDLRHDDDYGTRCDTFSNKFFAFSKNSAAAANSSISNSDINEVNYRMYLFTADYSIRRIGNHNSFDYANMQQSGTTSYLNPSFLKDAVSNTVIHTKHPGGYLIVHQDMAGSNAKSIITRIDINHKKIWESPAGISTKIANCIVKEKYCIITGNTSYMLSPHVGKDALCIIDMETGRIIIPSLSL